MMTILTSGTLSTKADDRFDIVTLNGRDNSIVSQPPYDTPEGQDLLKKLERISAHQFDGRQFWNENSKGVMVLCRFNPEKTAYVYVDTDGTPLYIEGCRMYTFFNRILVLDKPVAAAECRISPPRPKVCVRPQEVRTVVERRAYPVHKEFETGATYGRPRMSDDCGGPSPGIFLDVFGRRIIGGNCNDLSFNRGYSRGNNVRPVGQRVNSSVVNSTNNLNTTNDNSRRINNINTTNNNSRKTYIRQDQDRSRSRDCEPVRERRDSNCDPRSGNSHRDYSGNRGGNREYIGGSRSGGSDNHVSRNAGSGRH